MLAQPLAGHFQGVGADEGQPIHAGKGAAQRAGMVEVGGAHLHAALFEVGELFGGAAGGHDVGGSQAQEFLDDGAAQLAVGSGDQQTIIDVVHFQFVSLS